MNQITVIQTEKKIEKPINLSWKDNPAVQKLLNAVVSVLAEEYMQVAKQNPDVFSSKNGGSK